MHKTRLISAVVMAGGLVIAGDAHAQFVNECGPLMSCAALREATFSGTTLTLVVENTTLAHPNAFIGRILLRFSGGAAAVIVGNYVQVRYGTWNGATFAASSDFESWRLGDPTGGPGGAGAAGWAVEASDNAPPGKGGGSALRARPGDAVKMTITFETIEGLALEHGASWAAQMRSLTDDDGEWVKVVVTPEPFTVLLLGSGLAAIGGVSAMRRRRKDGDGGLG